MDRCALFVDASYVLADGAMAVHGTRRGESVTWDYDGLLQFLSSLARERSGLPLLRCYWYEASADGMRTPEHDALADLSGVKLRLAKTRPGYRDGVATDLHRDLTTLARNNAISEALVVSAEEDLAQVIADVQDLGLRVTLVHIAVDGNWTISRALRQESDDIIEISGEHLRPYVELIAGAEPARSDELDSGLASARSNGHVAGVAGYQAVPAGTGSANHVLPSIYTAPVVAEYQRPALQLPRPVAREDRQAGRDRDERGREDRARDDRARDEQVRDERTRDDRAEVDRVFADDRPRDDRPRDDRPREDRVRDDRPRDDRPREDRVRDDRVREDRAREDRLREDRVQREERDRVVQAVIATAEPAVADISATPPPGQLRRLPSRSQAREAREARDQSQAREPREPREPRELREPPPRERERDREAVSAAPHGTGQHGANQNQNQLGGGGAGGGSQQHGIVQHPPQPVPRGVPYSGPQPVMPAGYSPQPSVSLADAVQAAHDEGQDFGESVARDAPALWLEAVLARKPRMPSDLEARLLQGSALPIDFLLHDEVRHALRRGFWDALERSRR